jgi:Electron transfer DM13
MRHLIRVFFLTTVLFSCQEEGEMKIVDDEIDMEFMSRGMGTFVDLGTGHALAGTAAFNSNNANEYILRFENFSVVNGPDVNVYLSKTAEFKDVIDLGDLKGTQGSINYELASTINPREYKFVLIWCVKYAVLFGYAEVK